MSIHIWSPVSAQRRERLIDLAKLRRVVTAPKESQRHTGEPVPASGEEMAGEENASDLSAE